MSRDDRIGLFIFFWHFFGLSGEIALFWRKAALFFFFFFPEFFALEKLIHIAASARV